MNVPKAVPERSGHARHPVSGSYAGVVETHSGVVFFVGDRAYKMKRPVSFGFLDFTKLEARKLACQRESDLNSRLAPDVYLGTADVLGPDRATCEHLVVMRRLPEDRRLSVVAGSEALALEHLHRIAQVLADFHSRAVRSAEIDACATASVMFERWQSTNHQMEPLFGRLFDADVTTRILRLARRYLDGRSRLFEYRVATGRVCDGHGDLLCDDIFCLEDGPRILDCLEFDDQLRYVDVLADVASLAMDLERLGQPELGLSFLRMYAGCTGDDWPDSLAQHYTAYRAHVRAMVTGLRYDQGDSQSGEEARRLLSIAARNLEAGRVRLVVFGGLPGSGKSTLARHVAKAIGGTIIRSDAIRKELVGMKATNPAPADFEEGIYSAEVTAKTYEAMLERARSHLILGRSVVLDATFNDSHWRTAAAELATSTEADLDQFRCVAPMPLIRRRIQRRTGKVEISDATVAVAERMARSQTPWPASADVATGCDVTESVTTVLKQLNVEAMIEVSGYVIRRIGGDKGPFPRVIGDEKVVSTSRKGGAQSVTERTL